MAAMIQIVEDDATIAELLIFNLEREGYTVLHADNGEDALADIRTHRPQLVIMDWMLPDKTGVDIVRQIRFDGALKATPIIMLTARSDEDDKVLGLEVGADDYVTKPFSMRELMTRVKGQLRQKSSTPLREYGDIKIDTEKMIVSRGKRIVRLSPKEFDVLEMLSARPGRVFSRESILDHGWGIDGDVEIRTVDVVIGRLRRALKRGAESDPIRTVRGTGYAWDET